MSKEIHTSQSEVLSPSSKMSGELEDTLRKQIREYLECEQWLNTLDDEDANTFPLEMDLTAMWSLLARTNSVIEIRNLWIDYEEEWYYMYHDPMKSILWILELFEPIVFKSEEAIFQHLSHLYDKLVQHKESLTPCKNPAEKIANVVMEYINDWEKFDEEDLRNLIFNYLFENE